MRRLAMISAAGALLAAHGTSAAQETPAQDDSAPPSGPVVIGPVGHQISPPLWQLPPVPPSPRAPPHRVKPLLPTVPAPRGQMDPVVQTSTSTGNLTISSLQSWLGLGVGLAGVTGDAFIPPDTNGAAGATQYVQVVNDAFGVFDKTTGALLYPATIDMAVGLDTLWSGFTFNGPAGLDDYCAKYAFGDPIVLYDKAAGQWVITQMAGSRDLGTPPFVPKPPFYQCFAVSQTSDATQGYFLYAFAFNNLPDYPKIGTWPDAYYYSANAYKNGTSFAGAMACAFDRSKMLVGDPDATGVCFQLSRKVASLLPSDLDGATLPPASSPNYYLNLATSRSLGLWEFHADFSNPASSTFAGPASISVDGFTPACGGGVCIPQKGTSQQLDSLGDRLMHRLAYRNFGDHEALVVNHSVAAGGAVGARWYELRKTTGGWSVNQQSTYAPAGGAYRWMGSVAMDKVGNIALGYSVSSSELNPGIRFAARSLTDVPPSTLETETSIIEGLGSQTESRWGDYSSMSIDPADDCTFWYTNEYLQSDGAWNWSTRFAKFKFANCN